MNTPTYEQQWQKITSAYLNNKLEPYISCSCFIGNLLNNRTGWCAGRDDYFNVLIGSHKEKRAREIVSEETCNLYSLEEIYLLEGNFLRIYEWENFNEDALFNAMTSTLEMLRQIHISKGEQVDIIPLQKRELQTV